MSETRKLAAILVADIVGYSRLAGADEDRILARLRTLRSDLIDPTVAVHRGRFVKRTGDGAVIEFRSVVDAVRCAIEVQNGLAERNAGLPEDRRIEFRVGIHIGDVVEEEDGDLMGDGVNIAARLEGVAKPGAIHSHLAQWEQAIEHCRLAVQAIPNYWVWQAEMVFVNAWLGRDADAKAALTDLLKLKPDLTVKGYKDTAATYSDNPVLTQQIAHMAEGLRKAGLPEQ
jgi:hypothetical protein